MGRNSTVDRLPADQASFVDRTIREFRYCSIDGIKALLDREGIAVPRSTLGRYVRRLEYRDARLANAKNDTIVVIIERATGKTLSTSTTLSPAVVVSMIDSNPSELVAS